MAYYPKEAWWTLVSRWVQWCTRRPQWCWGGGTRGGGYWVPGTGTGTTSAPVLATPLHRYWPLWDQYWPLLASIWPQLASIYHYLASIHHYLASISHYLASIWPQLATIWLCWPLFGLYWPLLDHFWTHYWPFLDPLLISFRPNPFYWFFEKFGFRVLRVFHCSGWLAVNSTWSISVPPS